MKTKLVSKSLSKTEYDVYKPMWLASFLYVLFLSDDSIYIIMLMIV